MSLLALSIYSIRYYKILPVSSGTVNFIKWLDHRMKTKANTNYAFQRLKQ